MNLNRLWAVARKEFLHVVRDVRSLWLTLAMPVIMLVLFGWALTLDVNNVPLIVWDQDGTAASRELVAAFNGSRYFKIVSRAGGYAEVDRAVDSGRALAALIIPRGFGGRLESGSGASVQFIVDGSDSNTAQIAVGYATAATGTYSDRVALDMARRTMGETVKAPVDFRPRVWFNTELESKNFIVPGLIATIMMVITGLLTALTISREWERGTMEQVISTPIRAWELVVGKLVPYFVIGIIDMALVVVVGKYLFDVPVRGSVPLLFGMGAVFLVGALAIGMLVSVFAKSMLVANQVAMIVTFVPSVLLSGFMFSIDNMPLPLQCIAYCVPATYFIKILRGIYLKGVGLESLGLEAAVLTVFAVVMIVVATLRFRKKLG